MEFLLEVSVDADYEKDLAVKECGNFLAILLKALISIISD
jgi:hypothetical protein